MANRLAIGTGNWLTGGTWVSANTAGILTSTSTSTTALTTSNLDSATFVLTANAIQYIAIRLGTRAAGSPSNKLTVILRNSTTATDIWTFVLNVSDLVAVASTGNDNGGWYVFKNGSTHTPNGADSYLVRCKLDSTSTAVALCTNGTANNWQHIVFLSATGAPAAGDDQMISGLWDTTNPAVKTDVVVTMNETAATDYGSANTNYRIPAIFIGKGGTLSVDTTASSTFQLKHSGWMHIAEGGTFNAGKSGAIIPRTSTYTHIFDCAADGDFGIRNNGTLTGRGDSRLAGVSGVWATLTADAAIASTTFNTSVQLSAKNGDTLILTTTGTGDESLTLNADAGASSVTTSAGSANLHRGTHPYIGEAFCLDRNVIFKSTTDGLCGYMPQNVAGTCDFDWVQFRALGAGTNNGLWCNGSGTVSVTHCVFYLSDGTAYSGDTLQTGAVTFTDNVGYNCQLSTNGVIFENVSQTAVVTFQRVVVAKTRGSAWGISLCGGVGSNFSTIRLSGIADVSLVHSSLNDWSGVTLDTITCRNNGGWCATFVGMANTFNYTLSNLLSASCKGMNFTGNTSIGFFNVTLTSPIIVSVGAANNACLRIVNPIFGLTITDAIFAGSVVGGGSDSAFVFPTINNTALTDARLYNIQYGGSSPYSNLSVAGIVLQSSANLTLQMHFHKLTTNGATEFSNSGTFLPHSYILMDYGPSATPLHKAITPYGTVTYETTTVDASPVSIKLTPSSAAVKLDTTAMLDCSRMVIPVDSGQTPTISIKVQKDGSYNGNPPRFIAKRNDAIGITADTVLATFSAGSGVWQSLSATLAAVTDRGLVEVVVDCDGTAGNIFVSTLAATGASTQSPGATTLWQEGLAHAMVATAGGGGGGSGGISRARAVNK